jgi:hypothetical protein
MWGSVSEREPGRLSLLVMLGAFLALTVLVVAASLVAGARKQTSSPVAEAAAELSPEAAAFLGPLATGAHFGLWHVAHVLPSPAGCLTLEIAADDGEHFVVDVRQRSESAPPGIAETPHLALYVRSTAPGSRTKEGVAHGVLALAEQLQAREEAGHAPPVLESLSPETK